MQFRRRWLYQLPLATHRAVVVLLPFFKEQGQWGVAGESRFCMWPFNSMTVLDGAAFEWAFDVKEDGHHGICAVYELGGRSTRSFVYAHVFPLQPRCLETVDDFVVLPPLPAPSPTSIWQGALLDDSEEVFHEPIKVGIE